MIEKNGEIFSYMNRTMVEQDKSVTCTAVNSAINGKISRTMSINVLCESIFI